MAFDQPTRNRLQRFVNDARKVLEEEFTRQLQNDYGLDPVSGAVTAMDKLRHLNDAQRETARILRDTLAHYRASQQVDDRTGLDRIVREQAFTVLNRLAALRLAEARGLLVESVGNGYQAKGFQLYARLAGTGLGETGDAYRVYLFSVFDELAHDLPPLFDRYAPQGRLFPREAALLQVLPLINHAEIEHLWAEDETIGWIYQYFNSKEERKAMRDASQAPRNSRELAVRNQFFTPRYVVEFLVDNTLGRMWYEMTQGQTSLKDTCQYLVRRPTEIFIAEFSEAPELPEQEGLSQEQMLQQPVYIPHRPMKDSRELKILDPACGSGHFLLYAFDLLAAIYEEAWTTDERFRNKFPACWIKAESVSVRNWDTLTCYAHGTPLNRENAMLVVQSFGPLDPPGRFHLYGPEKIEQQPGMSYVRRLADMDWKSFLSEGWVTVHAFRDNSLGNITCEEYTQEEALANFRRLIPRLIIEHNLYGVDIDSRAAQIASLALWLRAQREWHESGVSAKDRPRIGRGHIVAAVAPPAEQDLRTQFAKQLDFLDAELFEKTLDLLKGLPELGVLLQVERELPKLIRNVFGEHDELFRAVDEEQWEKAEARLRGALTDFAQAARATYQGRLFAQDALEGLRMIDLCREVFDVVVMNPPFGALASNTKDSLGKAYPRSKNDLLAVFVERGLELLHGGGRIGAITSRTCFFLSSYQKWREDIVLGIGRPEVMADLGHGVMDDAMVEAAAYVLEKVT